MIPPKILFLILFLVGCKTYVGFKFEGGGVEVYTTHQEMDQPYCRKVCIWNVKYNRYDTLYCIISPCCTGIYFDTSVLHKHKIKAQ
jgi:hypothetical protein